MPLCSSTDTAPMLALQASCTDRRNVDICPSQQLPPPWKWFLGLLPALGVKAARLWDVAGTRLLGQEGSREQQPITASWCQQGFTPPFLEGQVMQEGGESRAGPYPDPYLSSLPPCCSSWCPFPPFPAEPLSPSSTLLCPTHSMLLHLPHTCDWYWRSSFLNPPLQIPQSPKSQKPPPVWKACACHLGDKITYRNQLSSSLQHIRAKGWIHIIFLQ